MYTKIEELVEYIKEQQPIFSKGEYLINDIDLIKGGATDLLCKHFYVRNYRDHQTSVISESQCSKGYLIIHHLRLIAKFDDYKSDRLRFMLKTLNTSDISIKGFSDDTRKIFKEEYNQELPTKDFHLIKIDFEFCCVDYLSGHANIE